ncbi:MAG: hypothetical protein JXA09_16625 [Anaerolineae bacterium]|nr:hypothetical protein [Anaerolineae bacterium]
MGTIRREWIAAQRAARYRCTPERRVRTVEEARAFVDEIGFCHFWPIKGVESPNLFWAIAGREREVPNAHDDPDMSRCWGWKDGALGQRWWYYGKVLRRKATLISLELFPYFYACSENYGDLDDYLDEYRAGAMTAEARQIYEALLEHGALDTVRLRREAHLAAEGAKARFERALVELQVGFKVLPIGVAEAGAWRYAFVYEIVPRHLPDLVRQARDIPRRAARAALVSRYIAAVVAADRAMVRRMFHVLDWTPSEWARTLADVCQEGLVQEAHVQGEGGVQLVSGEAFHTAAQ